MILLTYCLDIALQWLSSMNILQMVRVMFYLGRRDIFFTLESFTKKNSESDCKKKNLHVYSIKLLDSF